MEYNYTQPEDSELLNRLYADVTPSAEAVHDLISENTTTFRLEDDDRRFKAVVFEPEDPDGSVIFGLGEIGNGLDHTGGAVRVLSVRELANPNATVVWQPNETIGQSNVNASWSEKIAIARGDYSAFSRRFNTILNVLEAKKGIDKSEPMLIHGPSQGAALAPRVALELDAEEIAIAAIEAPNVDSSRNVLGLLAAFRASGEGLNDFIENNYPKNDENVTIGQDILNELTILGGIKFGTGLGLPTNAALGISMASGSFHDDIKGFLDRGEGKSSVFHVWGTQGLLSPNDKNAEIAERMITYNNYGFMTFEGGHAGTNNNIVAAAAGRQALRLLQIN